MSVAAVVLAAGRSSRMGSDNKLLLDWRGQPMVKTVAQTALAASFAHVLVVTGHQAGQVRQALNGCPVRFVDNPDYAEGLSTSVRRGVEAAPAASGYCFLLGDMPQIQIRTLSKLLAAFKAADEAAIVVPTSAGRRGNPALIGRTHRPALLALQGDRGARPLLQQQADRVVEVAVDDPGIAIDVDTPEAYRSLGDRARKV